MRGDKLNSQREQFDNVINKFTKPLLYFSVGLIIITTIIYCFHLALHGSFSASALGDFLGGYLGSMLSVLTVLLVFQTYYSQKEELSKQKQELKLHRNATETSRIYDLLYREVDSIVEYISLFEKDVRPLYKYSAMMENDIKNKLLLNKRDDTIKRFEDRYTDICTNLFPFIEGIDSFFRRVEYLLADRKDKTELTSLAVNRLPKRILILCQNTSEYLRDLKINPNRRRFENYNEEELLKTVEICSKIKEYYYDDIFRDK